MCRSSRRFPPRVWNRRRPCWGRPTCFVRMKPRRPSPPTKHWRTLPMRRSIVSGCRRSFRNRNQARREENPMFRQMLRAKIHRATVTEACLEYEGSLTVDEDLLDAAGILPYEAIVCSNLNNGERFMTYAMKGKRGRGEIVLNGPTARKAAVGDQIIIFCYEYYSDEEIKRHKPKIIQVDAKNRSEERRVGKEC